MTGFTMSSTQVSANSDRPDRLTVTPASNGRGRGDDEDSVSGSEHGNDGHGAQPSPGDSEPSELNSTLTTQALNADGTPKRPMNAFMIFARRRRPQVSAANQMMRTGEISKILSKEWNSMPMVEKQFYLDQAKRLKDTFNSKYPDYVYRRRPNNSRKKRRTDNGLGRPYDGSASVDPADDGSGSTEFEETSPTDMPSHPDSVNLSDHTAHHSLYQRHFPHAGSDHNVSPSTYDVPPLSASSHHSSSSYGYHHHGGFSDDFGVNHASHHPRLPHLSWATESNPLPSGPASAPPSTSPSLSEPARSSHHYSTHSDLHSHHHSHSPTNHHDEQPSHGLWNNGLGGRYEPPSRSTSGWPMPPSLTSVTSGRQRSLTTIPAPHSKPELFSPAVPHRAWSNTPSVSSGSSATSVSHSTPVSTSSQFQTLTAPFYPANQSDKGSASSGSTSPQLHRDPHQYFPPTAASGRSEGGGGSYEHSAPFSPITPPSGPYYSSHSGSSNVSGPQIYPSSHANSRGHHLLQPISTFPGVHNDLTSPPVSAGPASVPHGSYWDRVKSEAR